MFARVITLSRCSALALLVAAALPGQPNRDSKAMLQAEQTWFKASQATNAQRNNGWVMQRYAPEDRVNDGLVVGRAVVENEVDAR